MACLCGKRSNGVAAASHCGSHPAAPPGGPPRARCYKVNARRGSAAGLGAQNGTDLIAPASCGVTRDSGLEPEFTNIDIWQPGLPVLRAKMLAALRIRVAASVSSSPNISFACCRFGRERGIEKLRREGAVVSSRSRKVFPSYFSLPIRVEECSTRWQVGRESRLRFRRVSPRTARPQLRRRQG